MNVKNNIKELMDQKDISVYKLSKDIGLTYSNTHNIVNKDYLDRISFASILKISEALGCEISELYEWEE